MHISMFTKKIFNIQRNLCGMDNHWKTYELFKKKSA